MVVKCSCLPALKITFSIPSASYDRSLGPSGSADHMHRHDVKYLPLFFPQCI